ncbi:MAG: hypothetical protein MUF49_13845 [Oculatellaceae cyanobacterium Prado106]|nr:hypothetical protein [Oculatellaceae cyanobacterium Prado106]
MGQVSGDTPSGDRPSPQPIPFPGREPGTALTPAQQRRRAQRRQILESELDLRTEKLAMLRRSWAIETQAAVKFQLQFRFSRKKTRWCYWSGTWMRSASNPTQTGFLVPVALRLEGRFECDEASRITP